MKLLAALAAGYVLGARSGGEDLDDVVRSLRAIKDSQEFRDLLASLRSQASHALRDFASMVEHPAQPGDGEPAPASTHDLVERVRHLAGLR